MTRTLYLDCQSGIAGDMLVAALLDLGADEERLRDVLATLPLEGYEICISRVEKSGLDACDFDVRLDQEHENHDHDMAWLHGHDDGHAHQHAPDDGGHHHDHRTLADVTEVIEAASLSPRAHDIALKTFSILASAEAKAHGTTPDAVHFHEVGAVDSIVDIVSAATCLDDLDIGHVVLGTLSDGHGTIRCAHGIIPIPVPAVVNVATEQGLTLHATDVEGELVTPTGAALAATIRTETALPASYRIERVGLGAGKRDYACTNVLRAMLIEAAETMTPPIDDPIWKLECDIDDCTGEALGHAMEHLLASGAREVHYLPIFTKKGRPAWQLQVICDKGHIPCLEAVIFGDTTTIGIRRCAMARTVLSREERVLDTPLGTMRAKVVTLPDGSSRAYPEYDDVSHIADERGLAFQDVWEVARAACHGQA